MDACFFHPSSYNDSRQSHLRPRNIENTFVRIEPPSERETAAVAGLLSLVSNKRKRELSASFSPSSCPDVGDLQAPCTDTESLSSDKQEEASEWTASQPKKQSNHFKQRRRTAAPVPPQKRRLWDVVAAYFRVFRHGLQARSQAGQVAFLRASMSREVAFNSGQGTEAMIRSWKCLSLWFKDVELERQELAQGPQGALVATTVTSVTITERTLRNVFPHLSADNARYDGLAEKLLGRRLVMNGSTRFEWDPVRCCVGRVVAQSDVQTPMTRLLRSKEDAARVFEKAILSAAFQWRLTST